MKTPSGITIMLLKVNPFLTWGDRANSMTDLIKGDIWKHGETSSNAWCASFVHWCLAQNGIKGAGAKGANYSDWGIKLDKPAYGAIVIFKSGHVGFYVQTMKNGNYKILHGNWGDRIQLTDYTKPSEIQEFRYPIIK